MDTNSLQHFLERPEVLREILAGYSGPYSLGIGRGPVVILQVEGATESHFPSMIELGGEEVQLVVKRDFRVPVPLSAVRTKPLYNSVC
jgi:hypothetical protein